MTSPDSFWPGFVGGGLAAAAVTLGANILWDLKKQKLQEAWERRRYRLFLRFQVLNSITDLYYAAKHELYILQLDLAILTASYSQDRNATAQGLRGASPQISAADLDAQTNILCATYYRSWQEAKKSRWLRYNESIKNIRARAESHVDLSGSIFEDPEIRSRLLILLRELSRPLEMDNDAALAAAGALFEDKYEEMNSIRRQMLSEIQ